MRLTQPTQFDAPTEIDQIPSVRRALEAHQDDVSAASRGLTDRTGLEAAPVPPCHCSKAFLSEARRVGVSEESLREALGSGSRNRQWDGCVLVQDWVTGVELRLDPTERFGISVRRVA